MIKLKRILIIGFALVVIAIVFVYFYYPIKVIPSPTADTDELCGRAVYHHPIFTFIKKDVYACDYVIGDWVNENEEND